MRVVGLILSGALVFAAGCDSGEFAVAPAGGTVMCEGAPVPHAMVFFEPLSSGNSALVGKQGIGVADESGKFVISTYGDNDGAVVGKHRVRVGSPNAELHPGFSCPCTVNPEIDVMEVEVTKSGENNFEVVLKKKAAREKLSIDELEALEDAKEAARMEKASKKG